VEPTLEPVENDSAHLVACLLDTGTRKRIWGELAAGRNPVEARVQTLGDEPPPETVEATEGDLDLAEALPSAGDEPAVASGDQTTEGEGR
jgi:hypothetical protein